MDFPILSLIIPYVASACLCYHSYNLVDSFNAKKPLPNKNVYVVAGRMEIQVPSPSVYLNRSSITSTDLSTTVNKNSKQKPITSLTSKPTTKHSSSNTSTGKSNTEDGTTQKPKQSKSRNGELIWRSFGPEIQSQY